VRNRNTSTILRGFSLFFIIAAVVVTIIQLVGYSRQRSNYPPRMTIAGVSVGGVNPQIASQRVLEVYSTPIEVQYAGATIQIEPSVIGFELDLDSMIAAADQVRTGSSFWGGFWDYLWNSEPTSVVVPLRASVDEARLRAYLQDEISARYDTPPEPAQPVPGSVTFAPGEPGQTLDVDRAVTLIEDALRSPTSRSVLLTVQQTAPARPTLQNLQVLLEQTIALANFDGVIGLYMLDLQTGQEVHFALNRGQEISVEPDVAFTAASTIKIPVLVSYFIQHGTAPVDDATNSLILNMIHQSDNPSTDELMATLDQARGPLVVTDYMHKLGLEDTFIVGYFALGSPRLETVHTPANQRTDVTTEPDSYNQTTPSDMGMLLEDIYQCSQNGGGALVAAFPDKIDQDVCKQIVNYLAADKIGVLIEAGVPEGTQVAHKHGWVNDPVTGLDHDWSDAGIVYTPGGNFVLSIYSYHPVQLVFVDTNNHIGINHLFANLTEAVYNYFNLPTQ
jgi:beta-lactamase class A